MKFWRTGAHSSARGTSLRDVGQASDSSTNSDGGPDSMYTGALEFNALESPETTVTPYVQSDATAQPYTSGFKIFAMSSKRIAIVSSIITFVVLIIAMLVLLSMVRVGKKGSTITTDGGATIGVTSQDVALQGQNAAITPPEISSKSGALLINGDIIGRGDLRLANGSYVTVLTPATLSANQSVILPDASGTICLDSNNCKLATQAELQTTNAQLSQLRGQLGQIVVPTVPVATTLNGAAGAISIQGTSNQISVSTVNGVISLAAPQDIAPISSPTFAGLLLTGNFAVNGTVTLPFNCTANLNGGALTTNGSGQIICSDDDSSSGGGGAVTTPGGTTGTIAMFTAAQTIADSLISQAVGTVTVGGNADITGSLSANALTLTTALTVANGGTGATSFTANGVVIGNGAGALATTAAPAGGQVLLGNAGGVPTFTALTGDVAITGAGVTAIQANSVALGVDTAGDFVANLGTLTGLSVTGNSGEGSTPNLSVVYGSTANTAVAGNTTVTLSAGNGLSGGGVVTLGTGGSVSFTVAYGAAANTAVEGNVTLTCPTGGGNLTGGGNTITLGTGGSCNQITTVNNPTFTTSVTTAQLDLTGAGSTGTLQVANLGQATTYTLPDPGAASATICLSTGNCAGSGGGVTSAGGTADRLSKFTGSNSIGDSSVTDNGSLVTITGTANLVVQGGNATLGTLTQAGTLLLSDGSSNTVSIIASGLAADRTYTLPDAGGPASFCLSSGNCVGGGAGSAPNAAAYIVASLDGTLSNERALAAGSNISITDGGANANMTVATVQNPTFTTSVTTPILQSSNALTISSAAGNIVAVDAGTTIELQDSTNVTGDFDASGTLTAGTSNAFQVNASGAIAAATGITSSGTIRFSGYNCTGNANGGKLTTDGSGNLTCADDNGGAGSAISGSGTNGTIPLFNGAQTITDSIITQSGSTITITGDLSLTTDLTVANGGTGASTFTSNGVLYGNGAGAIQATAAGTSGQVLVANATGVPTFVSFSNDVTVTDTGAVTIANNAVTSAKIADGTITGTDIANATVANSNLVNSSVTVTAGNGLSGGGAAALGGATSLAVAYGSAANTAVQGNTSISITAGTGLSGGGSITLGAGGSATLDVTYGSALGTAVQGNVTLTCPAGAGNLSGGGGTITLGSGGSCGNLSIVNSPTFTTSVTTPSVVFTGAGNNGTVQIANLGQATVYTLPDPGAGTATICLSTGNCATAGAAGGDLTGNYPNPTIAKLQGSDLNITSPTAGHVLIYNGSTSAWENHAISSDITIGETGVATIANDAVTSAKIANGTITGADIANNTVANGNLVNSSVTVTAGTGLTGGGAASLGGSTTLNVAYGSSASTAVEGNTSISVSAGTNLTGGGSITLGAGGSVTLNVTNSPNFSGTLVAQGATITVGAAAQQGSLVLNDGSANTGTVQTAALGQDTVYTLPDPGAGTATICLSTGNCAGAGSGVTTAGGTTNRLSKFTGAQAIGDSSISDNGSIVTINGTVDLVIQGGNATLGTTTQAGTLNISDGSSNTVSIVAAAHAANQTYTIPDVASSATFCMSTGNCVGGAGGAPNAAAYLVATLDGTLSNERALAAGSNISITDGGANANMTVATVQNPTFTTSVTTPLLQSSGVLTLTSAAGNTIAIDAGTTIELQDSTNVTGDVDISGTFTSGGSNAFQINSSGAITAATGVISSGTVRFSSYNCTGNANGGKLTTDGSGNLTCADDNGGSGTAISGTGTSGAIPVFTGAQTIADSVITQSGSAITITGTLAITNALTVANGGTGASTLTSNGVLYGNGTGAIQATAAGTTGQVLVANGSGVPAFVSFSGDVTVAANGTATIAANAVGSSEISDGTITGTDIASSTVDNSNLVNSDVTVSAGNGLSGGGAVSLGGTTSLAVVYGNAANTAVQGNTGITVTAGTNLTGGGSITLGAGGTVTLDVANSPIFSGTLTVQGATATIGTAAQQGSLVVSDGSSNTGTLTVAALGQDTVYTLPDPGAGTATICLVGSSSCGFAGSSGSGSYIQNQNAAQQSSSNFWISGTGRADTSLLSPTVDVATAGTLSIGNTTATAIALGKTGITTTNAGALTVSELLTGNLGATISGATTSINASSNFATNINTGTSTGAVTIGNGTSTAGTVALQGGASSSFSATNATGTTKLAFAAPSTAGTVTFELPAGGTGGNTYGICTTLSVCTGYIGSSLTDNIADALDIQEGTNNYININTTNGSENISFGNATTNPSYSFLSTGTTTYSGSIVVSGNQSIRVTGGNTASRPASPTEGMVYYDTATHELIKYNGTKWVSDHNTTTKIVAASNSSQALKDAADYVADGTGDQVEINAALTAAAGGTVYLAEGTYSANATITIPNNTTLAGAGMGTLVQLADIDATENLIENTDTTTGTGITIRDLKLDGQQSLQSGSILQYGIYLDHMGSQSAGRVGAHINNVFMQDFRDVGLFLETSQNNTITNSTFYSIDAGGSAPNAIYLSSSADNTFSGNTFLANYWGMRLDGSSTRNNIITSNVFRSNTQVAIFHFGAMHSTITGNTFDSNNLGVNLYTSGDSTVSGNTFYANTGYSVFLDDSSSNTITGNRIQNSGNTTDNNAIYIQNNSDSNTITSNTITDSSATVTNYAIRIASAGSDTNYLSDNSLGGGTINDSGTGTVYGGQSQAANGDFLFRGANSATAFRLQNANGTSTYLNVDSSTNAVSVANATINLNASSNFATNINTGTSTGAVTIGNNSNTNNTVTIAAGATGGINLQANTNVTGTLKVTNSSTNNIATFFDSDDAVNPVLSIADEGGMIFQNNTDSDAAYLFKNAAGTTIFNVDTANNRVGTSNVSSAATNSQAFTVRTGNSTGSGSSNSGDILLRSGNSTNATSGNVGLEVGAAGTTFGSINIGTDYRANAINIGQVSSNSIQSTVNIATSTAGTQTVNIGSSSVAGNTTTIRGGSTGGINLIGVTNINTTGTAATSIGNTTGNLALQGDGTVTLASSNGTNSTNITFFSTQTAGNISYRLDRSVTAGNYEICTTAATTACTTAFAPTLQQGYNNDVDGSDSVIALTSADDSIILRNPAASGTDSTYVLTIDQLATGAKGGLNIQSAGTGNLLLITDTTATARDVLTVANGGATVLRNQTDSAAAFQVKNAADTKNVLTVDTANARVGVGMTPSNELDVAGTIRAVHPSFVGDYLVLEGTSSNQFFTVNNNGWINYRPLQDGANAFNIREETGVYDMFSVDTANARVSIGRGSPGATLHVEGGDDADVAAYITGASTSHTADLLQIAKSDGASNVATIGADGATLFRNNANSTTAFRIQSATGSATLFTADTTNLRLYVGSSTTDATAILLVVDSYNGSSDPTGVAGGQYYSSDKAAFRCYENGSWKDCSRASYEFADVNDEFLSGDKGANPVGTLGWACWSDNGGCGSGGNTYTESGHPGQVLLSTGSTTAADGTKLFLSSVTPTDFDRATFIVTPRTTLTNNAMRVGLIEHDTWMVSPGHGAYFGYLGAGGNWIAVTRNAGSETTCDTGVAPGVGTWARMEIRRNGSGNYEFYINGTLTCTNTTNLPGTTTKQDPTVMVVNASTSESYIEVDYFSMRTKVLSR